MVERVQRRAMEPQDEQQPAVPHPEGADEQQAHPIALDLREVTPATALPRRRRRSLLAPHNRGADSLGAARQPISRLQDSDEEVTDVNDSSSEDSEEEEEEGGVGLGRGAPPRAAAALGSPTAATEDWAAGLRVVNFHMQEEKVRALRFRMEHALWLNRHQPLGASCPYQPLVGCHLALTHQFREFVSPT